MITTRNRACRIASGAYGPVACRVWAGSVRLVVGWPDVGGDLPRDRVSDGVGAGGFGKQAFVIPILDVGYVLRGTDRLT